MQLETTAHTCHRGKPLVRVFTSNMPAAFLIVTAFSVPALAVSSHDNAVACVQACVHGDVFSTGVFVCVLSNSVTLGIPKGLSGTAERFSGRPAIHPVLRPLAFFSLTVIASNKLQQFYILTLEDAANPCGSLSSSI